MTRRSTTTAKFVTGEAVFAGWRDDVLTGKGPVVFPHTLPVPEISPGHVTLLGGAPTAGKTALVMQCVVEALRHTPTLRALVANVEMGPAALLDRQLARLSGVEGGVIRHRRFGPDAMAEGASCRRGLRGSWLRGSCLSGGLGLGPGLARTDGASGEQKGDENGDGPGAAHGETPVLESDPRRG